MKANRLFVMIAAAVMFTGLAMAQDDQSSSSTSADDSSSSSSSVSVSSDTVGIIGDVVKGYETGGFVGAVANGVLHSTETAQPDLDMVPYAGTQNSSDQDDDR